MPTDCRPDILGFEPVEGRAVRILTKPATDCVVFVAGIASSSTPASIVGRHIMGKIPDPRSPML